MLLKLELTIIGMARIISQELRPAIPADKNKNQIQSSVPGIAAQSLTAVLTSRSDTWICQNRRDGSSFYDRTRCLSP